MRELPATDHVTFGGRMTSEAHGWLGHLARQLAREGHAGDFRNQQRVRAWAREIGLPSHWCPVRSRWPRRDERRPGPLPGRASRVVGGQMSQRFFWTMGSEAHQRPRPQACPA